MEASPSLGSSTTTRARTALLASGSTLSTDSHRRVVFLASQAGSAQTIAGTTAAGHETRTWPHHWSPNTVSRAQLLFFLSFSLAVYSSRHSSARFRRYRGDKEALAGNKNTSARYNTLTRPVVKLDFFFLIITICYGRVHGIYTLLTFGAAGYTEGRWRNSSPQALAIYYEYFNFCEIFTST